MTKEQGRGIEELGGYVNIEEAGASPEVERVVPQKIRDETGTFNEYVAGKIKAMMEDGAVDEASIKEEVAEFKARIAQKIEVAITKKGGELPNANKVALLGEIYSSVDRNLRVSGIKTEEKMAEETGDNGDTEAVKTDGSDIEKKSEGLEGNNKDIEVVKGGEKNDDIEPKGNTKKKGDVKDNRENKKKVFNKNPEPINSLGAAFSNPGEIKRSKKKENKNTPADFKANPIGEPAMKSTATGAENIGKKEENKDTKKTDKEDGRILDDAEVEQIIETGGGIDNFANFQENINTEVANLRRNRATIDDVESVITDLKNKLKNPVLIYLRAKKGGNFIGYRLMTDDEKSRYNNEISELEEKIKKQKDTESPKEEATDKAVNGSNESFDPERRLLTPEEVEEWLDRGVPKMTDVEFRFKYINRDDIDPEDREEAMNRLDEVLRGSVLKMDQYTDTTGKKHGGFRFMTHQEMEGLEDRARKQRASLKKQLKEAVSAQMPNIDGDAKPEASPEKGGSKGKSKVEDSHKKTLPKRRAIIPGVDPEALNAYDVLETALREAKGDPKKEADLMHQLARLRRPNGSGSHISATDPETGKKVLGINKPARAVAAPNTPKKLRIENEERGMHEESAPRNTGNEAGPLGDINKIPEPPEKPILFERVKVSSKELFTNTGLPAPEFTTVEDALDEPGFAHFLSVLDKKDGGRGLSAAERIERGDDNYIKEQYELFVSTQVACKNSIDILKNELLATYKGEVKITPEIENSVKDYFADIAVNEPFLIEEMMKQTVLAEKLRNDVAVAQAEHDEVMTKLGGDEGIAKKEQELVAARVVIDKRSQDANNMVNLMKEKGVLSYIKKVNKIIDLMASDYIENEKVGHLISPTKHLQKALDKMEAEIRVDAADHANKFVSLNQAKTKLEGIRAMQKTVGASFLDAKRTVLDAFLPYEIIKTAVAEEVKKKIDETLDSAKSLEQLEKAQVKIGSLVSGSEDSPFESLKGDISDTQERVNRAFRKQIEKEILQEMNSSVSSKSPKKPYQRVWDIIKKRLYGKDGAIRKIGSKEGSEAQTAIVEIIQKIAKESSTSPESKIHLARIARSLTNPFSSATTPLTP